MGKIFDTKVQTAQNKNNGHLLSYKFGLGIISMPLDRYFIATVVAGYSFNIVINFLEIEGE